MFAMYSFLSPTLPTKPETPQTWESVDGQKFTPEGYPAIPDNTEVLWWDWDVDYPPGTKRAFFVKGQLKREVFSCEELNACEFPRGKPRMERWSIISQGKELHSFGDSIYLGMTSWWNIYSHLPVERRYPIANFWGYDLRKIANNGKEYLFFVSYNVLPDMEFSSIDSAVEDRRIMAGQ